jgi:hypothetical protein
MDEWMQLNSGEAAYRQQAQRVMRQTIHTSKHNGTARRVRAAFAAALIALASRVAPVPVTPPPSPSAPLAPAQS